jgi:hypothetical protein
LIIVKLLNPIHRLQVGAIWEEKLPLVLVAITGGEEEIMKIGAIIMKMTGDEMTKVIMIIVMIMIGGDHHIMKMKGVVNTMITGEEVDMTMITGEEVVMTMKEAAAVLVDFMMMSGAGIIIERMNAVTMKVHMKKTDTLTRVIAPTMMTKGEVVAPDLDTNL